MKQHGEGEVGNVVWVL